MVLPSFWSANLLLKKSLHHIIQSKRCNNPIFGLKLSWHSSAALHFQVLDFTDLCGLLKCKRTSKGFFPWAMPMCQSTHFSISSKAISSLLQSWKVLKRHLSRPPTELTSLHTNFGSLKFNLVFVFCSILWLLEVRGALTLLIFNY